MPELSSRDNAYLLVMGMVGRLRQMLLSMGTKAVTEVVLLLAMLMKRPPALVDAVFHSGGLECVAVVEMESNFSPRALRREPRGHTSYGLFQINDEWHPQYRYSLSAHIAEGVKIWRDCPGDTVAIKVSHFNGGTFPGEYSIQWGQRVQRKYDSLAMYIWLH